MGFLVLLLVGPFHEPAGPVFERIHLEEGMVSAFPVLVDQGELQQFSSLPDFDLIDARVPRSLTMPAGRE